MLNGHGHGRWANLGPAKLLQNGETYIVPDALSVSCTCPGSGDGELFRQYCKIWQKTAMLKAHGKFAWNELFEEPGYTWHVCVICPSQVGGPDCTHVTFSSNCRQHCRRSLQFRFNPALPEAQASLTETLLPIVLWVNCHVLPNFDKISSQPLDPFELIMMCYKERIVDYHCLLNISRCYRVCAKATKWWI